MGARQIVINPANKAQRYILWGNGRIEVPLGSTAVPVPQAELTLPYGGTAPTFYYAAPTEPAIAMQVTDWTTPGGYTLDIYGSVYQWGSASAIPGTAPPNYYAGGNPGGLSLPDFGFVYDFKMNPAGNGQGYYMQLNGDVIAFGTGVTAVAHSAFLDGTSIQARQMIFDWTSKRYWIIDNLFRIWGVNGGSNAGLTSPALIYGDPSTGTYGVGSDIVYGALAQFPAGTFLRGAAFNGVAAAPTGWATSVFGFVSTVGAAQIARYEKAYTPKSAFYADLAIVDDGSGANPLRLVLLTQLGTQVEFVSSIAPSVTVLAPVDPNTTTTRPYVTWSFGDPDNDAMALAKVRVFTAAQYGIGGFDPAVSPATWETTISDQLARRVQIPIDIANATYRAYMQVTDTSGLASTWQFKQWVQNVTPPATPTVAATALNGLSGISCALHVNPAGLSGLARFALQYQDAGSSVWRIVRNSATGLGAYGITPNGSGDATIVDKEASFGIARTYRASVYIYDATTDVWNGSAWSSTSAATLGPRNVWAMTNPFSATNDQIVSVDPNFDLVEPIVSVTFYADGRTDPIVITDGAPKSAHGDVSLYVLTNAQRLAIESMLRAGVVLLLRDLFGRSWFFRPVGDISWSVMRSLPIAGEVTAIRDAHLCRFTMQSIARPVAGPVVGPLAEA